MNNVYEFKKKGEEEEGASELSVIDVDQPFDYEDVVAVTGSEYVRNLQRDGISCVPYEELKRIVAGVMADFAVMSKYTNVSGFRVADSYYHHAGHSWAHVESDGLVRVGIDDFIARVLGPADAVNLPAAGTSLQQGEVGWELIRNGRKAPISSPVSGTVQAVNNDIKERPAKAHDDPYEKGWLFLLEPAGLENNLTALLKGPKCLQWMEKENQKLLELLGSRYERLAATGGAMIDDVYGHFPDIDWDRLVKTFLHAAAES